jgi:2-hydroxychromene-2-carboxylate isomerase
MTPGRSAYRTEDTTHICKRCGIPLGNLRERLFGTDGETLCATCFWSERQGEVLRQHRQRARRATLATALTLGSGATALAIGQSHGMTGIVVAIVILGVAHVAAQILSPRRFHWFDVRGPR